MGNTVTARGRGRNCLALERTGQLRRSALVPPRLLARADELIE